MDKGALMNPLSEHFSYLEGTQSATALKSGIDNTPPADILSNMQQAAAQLEAVREYLNQPMTVNSWYRCAALNAAVGGAPNSAHTQGWAIDFICPPYGSPLEIVDALVKTGIKFDQLIQEGTWCHISFDPRMRQQTLTAHFADGEPTTYTSGT